MSDRKYGRGGRLERANGNEYRYDGHGNLVEKVLSDGASWKYLWTPSGRLAEVVRPDGKRVTFAYDALGRRVRKEFDGTVTEFVWDGDDLVHERVSKAGDVQPLVTWLFEPGSFAPVAKFEGRKRFSVVTDHLGTPSMLMNEAGKLAWKAQLDIYGVLKEQRAGVEEREATRNPWRYPGQYEDRETGLYYNRFRYYDAESGRYMREDPIGLAGGLALFTYVGNPALWFDPFGLDVCANRTAGKAAEGFAEDALKNVSPTFKLIGKQVAVQTGTGRRGLRYIDLLFRDTSTGLLHAVEVKSGGATRSAAQVAKDQIIERGGGTFVGETARNAGLHGQSTSNVVTHEILGL
jgi:RHS repeat-associated protein